MDFLDVDQHIPDGFEDPGRNYPGQEVIVIDSRKDARLRAIIAKAQEAVADDTHENRTPRTKYQILSLLGSDEMGGRNPGNALHVGKWKAGSRVLIGDVRSDGVCRHRAFLFKYLCDRLGLPCKLTRGVQVNYNVPGGHAWNSVPLGGEPRKGCRDDNCRTCRKVSFYILNVMQQPVQFISETSDRALCYYRAVEYFEHHLQSLSPLQFRAAMGRVYKASLKNGSSRWKACAVAY